MATKTKTRAASKPSAKTAKPKSSAKPKSTKSTAKPKTAKRSAPKSTPLSQRRTQRDLDVAKKATLDMRENVRGAGKRAPVNATQVALVRSAIGNRSVATVAKSVFGFKSKAELARHARGELDAMPDGVSANLSTFARELSGPGASKIRGRKLTAIVAHL